MIKYYKYRVGQRKVRLSDSGNRFYVNDPENACAEALDSCGKTFTKRGYPDLTVYNDDGSIYGFIEIKPDGKELKATQQTFADFCQKHNIPFIHWTPSDGVEKVEGFLSAGRP